MKQYMKRVLIPCPSAFLLQYLCCEVAALQEAAKLRQLSIFDVAHMAWRLQTACNMEEAIDAHEQVRVIKQ